MKFFTDAKNKSGILKRSAPALAFIMALSVLMLFCHVLGYTSLPPTEKRYVTAKARVDTLKEDSKKSGQREPWEKLANEFKAIYDSDPAWPNRAAALFRCAESFEELAKRSCSRSDIKKAISTYETVALRHASSRLADDALFRAAKLRAASLRDDAGALTLLGRLKKQYPKGDMLKEAEALEKAIKASAKGKTAPDAIKIAQQKENFLDDTSAGNAATKKEKYAGDLPLRLKAAQSRIEKLQKDELKACWRQPWENLRDEFLKIAEASKTRLAPSALFYAAKCQQIIGDCSKVSGDSKKAIAMYANVAKSYPKSNFADDALLNTAQIQRGLKSSKTEAKSTLKKLIAAYPGGDRINEAKRLLAQWNNQDAPTSVASARASEPCELQVLSWDSPNKNRVEITLEMSGPVKYRARLAEAAKGQPAKLFIDLENASIVNDIRKGVAVRGSLLQAVRVKSSDNGASTLQFDLRDASKFAARTEKDPCRIIVSVAAGTASLPKNSGKIVVASKNESAQGQVDLAKVSNMASQLGLTVHTVFIDAGHGGKDPGTHHNNVLERAVALDVAMRLGRLLKANGLDVVYSRDKDKSVPLSMRTKLANAAKADLFVSIHVNAHDDKNVSGLETYYLNLASNKQAARVAVLENAGSDKRLADMQGMVADIMLNARVDESHRLAGDIQRLTHFRLKKYEYNIKNNGVKSAPFHVLLGAQMPAVLVELGYCTNPAEAKNLADAKYRNALAEGVAEGVLAYKDRLLHNRTAEDNTSAKQRKTAKKTKGI